MRYVTVPAPPEPEPLSAPAIEVEPPEVARLPAGCDISRMKTHTP